jgi:hypothetical protein
MSDRGVRASVGTLESLPHKEGKTVANLLPPAARCSAGVVGRDEAQELSG